MTVQPFQNYNFVWPMQLLPLGSSCLDYQTTVVLKGLMYCKRVNPNWPIESIAFKLAQASDPVWIARLCKFQSNRLNSYWVTAVRIHYFAVKIRWLNKRLPWNWQTQVPHSSCVNFKAITCLSRTFCQTSDYVILQSEASIKQIMLCGSKTSVCNSKTTTTMNFLPI